MLLVGLSLLFVGGVGAADQSSSKSSTGSGKSQSQKKSQSRPAADSRVLSTKPAGGNGVKMRVLTKDGRVRDVVVKDGQNR
ncbi:MAG: hypothetical protein DRQ54_01620 [Gammaproteobacteria bacterium]|nr:MAG: hypothetical protein DRQ54_01620 [Gammaproteobacteria bacterium]RLA11637.1 MAG: hypothetical protein DRQ52_09245 [Gammaproteobacteria bacterium]